MCMYDLYGKIVPGKCVGDFQIRWTYEQLMEKKLIQRDCLNKYMPDNVIHEIHSNIVIFINEENKIQEISANNNYKGKVNGLFGIGDCLIDFAKKVRYETSIYDSEGFFYFPDIPGLRVLNEKWEEEGKSPIRSIFIYDPVWGTEF